MTKICLIRHGKTAWNEVARYQGKTDIPLSDQGRLELSRMRIPEEWLQTPLFASPLARATETARILFSREPTQDPRLAEQDLGDLEGTMVAEARRSQDFTGPNFGWQGWQFAPPRGESYENLANRFTEFVAELQAVGERKAVLVTHKGVILIALALAHKWDMQSKRPFKIDSQVFHVLSFDPTSGFAIDALNSPLMIPNRP